MFKPSERTKDLKQSGIRAASANCAAIGGINLGQGICDIPTPPDIKQEAYQAIASDKNTYSACEGVLGLRIAIAEKLASFNQIQVEPETDIIVSHGSTGAFVCTAMTLFNPGDEIILFEPFYGYHKHILELQGMQTKSVPMDLKDFSIDFDKLKKAISAKTKAIIICTPCNPSGKVFSQEELLTIGEIARQHDLYIITDEIYEYITYPGYQHVSMASLEDFKERTITISGFSKTYNMTGWRLGYAAGPAEIMKKMALVQDLLYVCPTTPLQHAALAAFRLADEYYDEMRELYLQKRDLTTGALKNMGFKVTEPQGAYYILADFSDLDFEDDAHATAEILEKAHVACVPGGSFYTNRKEGQNILRICYALSEEQVSRALEQMSTMFSDTKTKAVEI